MIYAFFMSCVASTTTGAIECSNSYTEMASVVGAGESCEVQASQLNRDAIQAVLIENVNLVEVASQSGCGTLAEVKAKALEHHLEFVGKGIASHLYSF